MGYHQAGFDEIVGVDNKPQKRYPFKFIQDDAIKYLRKHGKEFNLIHASPPCQLFSCCTPVQFRQNHPDLIGVIRDELRKIGKPYVIENVPGAKNLLIDPIILCGSSFGLKLWRHRYFEIWPMKINFPPACRHDLVPIPVMITGTTKGDKNNNIRPKTGEYPTQVCREASGLHWMTRAEMDEAIPPAYTKWIGEYLLTGKRPSFPAKQGLFF